MTIQIETKHSIGDIVFFLKDDKIKTGTIYKMEINIDDKENRIYLYVRDENNDISITSEDRAFESKQQLIQSL